MHLWLIPRSHDSSSKKELYLALCDKSVLIDDDKKSIWVERANGKRCIMLSAMNLSIMWGNILHSWRRIPNPQARFEKVAELLEERWFEIRGRINTRILSPKTRYSVYIVFKKADLCYGFGDVAIEAVVGVVGQEPSRRYLCFNETMKGYFLRRERHMTNLVKPESRKDGWMELELGEFFNEGGLMNSEEIEMSILKTKRLHWKRGLIVQGIEIRPVKIRYEMPKPSVFYLTSRSSTGNVVNWLYDGVNRFEKVAELLEERWFEIRGRINTRILSPKTRYSVYIVFMKADLCYGFGDVAIEAAVVMERTI